jgi:hypothetical protein
MIWRDGKNIPFCINLHKSKLYNMWPTLLLELGPGLLFTMHQLLNLTMTIARNWSKGGINLGRVSILFFLSSNGTPTPSFIG